MTREEWEEKFSVIRKRHMRGALDLLTTFILVAEYFSGDLVKVNSWFEARNPLLGDLSPLEMIAYGRAHRLKRFVEANLKESAK